MNTLGQIVNQSASFNQNEINPIRTSPEKQAYDERHFRRRYIDALQKIANKLSKERLSNNEYVKIQFSEPNFKLKRMNELYSDETISYFTQEGLEDKQVYIINGLFYNTNLGLYNSNKPLNTETGDGEMIVMDRLGNMFIAPKERGIFHHSSFFSGNPVAFAALCFIKNGKIENLFRYSGHYTPGEEEENSFIRQFRTDYLVAKQAFNALKIDSKGSLVQTISISSKDTVKNLYSTIAEIGEFCESKLWLVSDGKTVSTSKLRDSQYVYITIDESNLKSGSMIYAIEQTTTPRHRIYPIHKFELIITD